MSAIGTLLGRMFAIPLLHDDAVCQVTVPTVETASATFWMEQRMAMGKAVMLVGPAGTGKTQLVMGALRSMTGKAGNDLLTSKINMNFYTR